MQVSVFAAYEGPWRIEMRPKQVKRDGVDRRAYLRRKVGELLRNDYRVHSYTNAELTIAL